MASFNKTILVGNLVRDPELKYTPSGMAICEFTLAVNDGFAKEGKDPEVLFIDIVTFNKTAENCGKFLKKGSSALVDGRLKLDKWQDKQTGDNRSKHSITANVVQFLTKPEGQGQPQSNGNPF